MDVVAGGREAGSVEVARLTRPYEGLPLECDGMTRVVTYVLSRAGIRHRVMEGRISVEGKGDFAPHWWVELPSGEVVDYRSRMWFGNDRGIPQGVFRPEGTVVSYEGRQTRMPVSDAIFGILTMGMGRTAGDVFKPPAPPPADGRPSVFLAGSIDMGEAEDWQAKLEEALEDVDCVILNPRRDDWDSTWKQEMDNPKFFEQVDWELSGMERADVVALCMPAGSKAPISLMELGLHAAGGKLVVHCPEGFWRKGNVDIVCARYGVPVHEDFAGFAAAVRERLGAGKASSLLTAEELALPEVAHQPCSGPGELFESAREAEPMMSEWLGGVAGELGLRKCRQVGNGVPPEAEDKAGPILVETPMKEMERAEEKVADDYGGDWSRLLDVVRATVAVEKAGDIPGVMEALRSSGMVVARRPKDLLDGTGAYGFRGVILNPVMPNGHVAELQVMAKPMLVARVELHSCYEAARELEGRGEEVAGDVVEHMVERFSEAWAEAGGAPGGRMARVAMRLAVRTKYKKVEQTTPGSKNHYKATYHDGQEKWVDSAPGRGEPSRRSERLMKKKMTSPGVQTALKSLGTALKKFEDGKGEGPIQKAVEKNEVSLDKSLAKKVNRLFVKNVKEKEGGGIGDKTKEGLQVVRDHVNRHRKDAAIAARLVEAMPPRLHIRDVMEEGAVSRRKQERAKARYVAQVGPWLQRLTGPGSRAVAIYDKAVAEFPGRNVGSVLGQRKSRWVKEAKQVPELLEFSEYVGGPDRMYGAALYVVRDVVLGQVSLRDAKASAERMADRWFVESAVESKAGVFEKGGYAEDFRKFLPPKISFEVGPTRDVLSIVETFGREKKNWETMARKLAFIAARFNSMVRQVKDDMSSPDEVTRLCALMTAITIETGLRPGEVGNEANVRDPETGEKVEVETFGVTTMQPRHVKFVRDNFAELRFIGKKGTEQVATLSDEEILGALREAVASTTLAGDTSMLFVTKAGVHVGYQEMDKYVKGKWGDITPTDFRKLKATREFYESLKRRADGMRKELASAVGLGKAKLKEAVVAKIMAVLEEAASEAQRALSHDDWKTTIGSYVDPRVVVNFLNRGGLDDTLEDILVNNKNVNLTFNFGAFVEQGDRKVAAPVLEVRDSGSGGESAADVMRGIGDLAGNLTGSSAGRESRLAERVARAVVSGRL